MDTLVPDDLWTAIAPLLPPEPLKPTGGRPPSSDRAALAGLILVLRSGLAWTHMPHSAPGCRGKTNWRRLGHGRRQSSGRGCIACCWSGSMMPTRWTGRERHPTAPACRPKGGEATGPHPTGRGKPGTKPHLVADARGTPRSVTPSGPTVMTAGRWRRRSMAYRAGARAGGDAPPGQAKQAARRSTLGLLACDHRRCRMECRARAIKPRIARRGGNTSPRLGRHRWVGGWVVGRVVERTPAWLARLRRLVGRHKRRVDLHLALTTLACALIGRKQAKRVRP